ncbi:MAG: PEP-CTERM sorting domain-containing protein [Pirellulales bacterium]
MNKSRSLAILAALFLSGAGQAHADLWHGFINNDWFLQGNWDLFDGPPGAADEAFLYDTPASADILLSSSTTIRKLIVNSPFNAQYTLTGSNGAVLTATEGVQFQNSDSQALNVHTLSSLGLNTPRVEIFHDAVLSLNNSTVTTDLVDVITSGRVDVNDGSSVQTQNYRFRDAAGEFRVNSGGELRVTGDTTLARGTTTINSGGQLNATSGVDLEYNGTALLQFFSGHAVDDGVHLKATGGADITSTSFIDVGNGNASSLTVTGSGSTFTAGGSTSDWGGGTSGNATVTISDSALATVAQLRAGTDNAQFAGTVSGGATLRTTSSFSMGGGAAIRQVSLDVNGGTFEVDGNATFNSFADLNLTAGTVNFDGGATFNAIGRIDWSGGSVNLGANTTLLVDGGTVNKTSAAGFTFSGNSTTRLKSGGSFTTPSYFDLGIATLDMNSATLTVGTIGGTVSDWGAGTATTATLSNNAVATYNSGLRMSINGGTTNATISSGARLVGSFLSIGGGATSSVTLNVNGGRVESPGTISLFRGTTATVSAGGRIEAQDIVLGFPGGTANLTVTGAGAFLDANGTLFAGREGTTTLTISGGADAEAFTQTVIGEIAGANSTVTVTGSGSSLLAGSSLTVGDGGAAALNVADAGFVSVFGGVSVNASSKIDLDLGGSLQIGVSSSIANGGEIELTVGSQIHGAISNAGLLRLYDSGVTRGVTLLADSQMFADNSSVATLVQQADAELLFELRGASDFDNLTATGAATLGGDLVVSLAGGFAPAVGAEFMILSAASVTGPFATQDFSAAPLGSGLSWDVLYSPNGVTLKVVAVVPGDYNNDGAVNAADYAVWRDSLGQNGDDLNADGNLDQTVNEADYTFWRERFGQGAPASGSTLATSTGVPEPTTLALIFIGGVATLRRRRAGT